MYLPHFNDHEGSLKIINKEILKIRKNFYVQTKNFVDYLN